MSQTYDGMFMSHWYY